MTSSTARPLAVVTGASSGIGYELAKQFAQNGFDLVIASGGSRIEKAAEELRALGGKVESVQADLATFDGVEQLYRRIRATGRPVDAAALNAGVGVGGDFASDTDLPAELNLIDLNVKSPVHLAKRLLPEMVGRGAGRVLFTSSIAATMPGPFQAAYSASKAFLLSFSEAIRNELKDTGVTVTALMPGPTDTEFFERADMLDTKVGTEEKDDPADVARDGFEALMAGKDHVVAGSVKNKLMAGAAKVLPEAAKAQAHRRMSEPGTGNQ
jgi:short-subunit dehydrogenase